ncbi:MAG: hypothetical protein ACYS7Y_11685 [Planctomycetota bacterium]|jgi:Mg-chelatase subunit ChlI
MEFKRKQRIKGKTAKHHKEWYDETKQYRIIWRDEVFGVEVQKGYSACVRCLRSPDDPWVYWGFAGRRGLYKTLKAAEEACVLNQQVWNKFLTIEGRDKVTQVRDLRHRSLVGKGKSAFPLMTDLPVWVASKASPRLLEILCSNLKNRTKTSRTSLESSSTSEEKSEIVSRGPARPATQQETSPDTNSDAPPAKEAKSGPTKRAGKPTKTRSSGGTKKRKASTASKRGKKRRSKSSRKGKSAP